MTKSSTSVPSKPVVLCILDGWGNSDAIDNNAIASANTPNFDRFLEQGLVSELYTSGLDVGLPEGQMGNSEVGHMNIGAGRVIMQNLPLIDSAIADGSLANNVAVRGHITALQESGGACHLMGLISDGGVHSHINHIISLAKIISSHGVPVRIHAFTDGRDTAPESGKDYMLALEKSLLTMDDVEIATVCGRYYAMDRDNRWDRVEVAYRAMVQGQADCHAATATYAVSANYANNVTDEFILPHIVSENYTGMKDGDGIFMANFRSDRVRQLLHSLIDDSFDSFNRPSVAFAVKTGLTEYSAQLGMMMDTAFPAQIPSDTLAQILANNNRTQLHIAETEKYAHVTFFFNGGVEQEVAGETRILVPSPNVPTYDVQPEMSSKEVTRQLVDAIDSGRFDFIVVNYANTDMVGHTGIMGAAVKAVEAVDSAIGRVWQAVENAGGVMMITADHGNAELMVDSNTGKVCTSHTTNPVPCVVLGVEPAMMLRAGRLCDIAPTLLSVMGIAQPEAMTGHNLLSAI